MAMVTAAVVGVIANLALWFALHVLFRQVTQEQLGLLRLFRPDLPSLDWQVAIVAVAAMLMVFRLRLGMLRVLAMCALMGLGLSYIA
jgi:chromate transporter